MKTNISIFVLLLCLAFANPLFSQVVINDEFFYKQWYLNMPGDDNTRADIRVLDAWSRTMGNSSQKIADIEGDNGGTNGYPSTYHDDLLGRITTQGYGITGEHSTNVAGLLVANHNTIGIAGVNKFAQLYSYVYTDVDQWADKVRDARLDGNKIINISQGLNDPMTNVWEQLVEAYNNNIVTVVSTGNNGPSITYPAVYSNTIAVGSSTKYNARSQFSNYGPQIEFLAPGGSDDNPQNVDNIYT
ncbi:MAG: S8 family peptidase, partial [Mobilitalea sp.]